MLPLKARINTSVKGDIQLTEIQLEILHMLAYEYNPSEIELEMKMPWNKIRIHLWQMYRMLGVTSRAGLIRVAFERKLLILA